jgi:pantoate--beta-alanine ligase
VREPDGLALSSRNAYLRGTHRQAATVLYRSLDAVRREIAAGQRDATRLLVALRHVVDSEPVVTLDYGEIVDAETFEPIITLRKVCYVLIAARLGPARLIDNALVEPAGESLNVVL